MASHQAASISKHFATLQDPRKSEACKHPLMNIVVIATCAVICGAESFTEIEEFGKSKRDWLSKFLDLSKGIPSHDTFNAVFACLNPRQFEQCLLQWMLALQKVNGGEIVAIDGKALRRSFDTASSKASLQMVSAWATANQLSLGQVAVDQESNETRAIPKLLEMLDVSGALVTIDAAGCQREIAQRIVDQGADYCLAVKAKRACALRSDRRVLPPGAKRRFRLGARPPTRDARARAWSAGVAVLFSLPGARGLSPAPSVAEFAGNRHGNGQRRARREKDRRRAVLHTESFHFRQAICGGGARSLGNRESLALATRCELSRRQSAPPSRPRCGEHEHHDAHGSVATETRTDGPPGDCHQT